MLIISREADYACRLMVHMAISEKLLHQAKELAAAEKIPEPFVFKILRTLTKHRLVRSFRGLEGGYQLAVDPNKLTLCHLIELMEGPMALNRCVMSGVGCDLQTVCAVHEVWVRAQVQLRQILESATMADLAKRTVEKRAGVRRPVILVHGSPLPDSGDGETPEPEGSQPAADPGPEEDGEVVL